MEEMGKVFRNIYNVYMDKTKGGLGSSVGNGDDWCGREWWRETTGLEQQ